MKAASFAYAAPASLGEALGLLAEGGDEAKVLAGGQSLVPLLALRFAQPGLLVDINRVPGLAGIRALPGGGVAIGAMTRTRTLETDPVIRDRVPLAAEAAPLVAHRAIRNRGTVGGAVAHADPAAELPAVMLALRATMIAEGPAGAREIGADAFFAGYYTTALEPGEILTELRVPAPAPGTGTAFLEISRRHGDFAMAGAAAVVTVTDRRCTDARIAMIGVADRPVAAGEAARTLVGRPIDGAAIAGAAATATAPLSPTSDLHAGAEYRRHLATVLVRRALALAARRAGP